MNQIIEHDGRVLFRHPKGHIVTIPAGGSPQQTVKHYETKGFTYLTEMPAPDTDTVSNNNTDPNPVAPEPEPEAPVEDEQPKRRTKKED